MIKRIFSLILALTMALTGCVSPNIEKSSTKQETLPLDNEKSDSADLVEDMPHFDSLSDKKLLAEVEDLVYRETIDAFDGKDYVVENVSSVYISKEYLEEVAFNSRSNVYFGYTLDELNDVFKGEPYIFTLGDNGKTTVKKLESIDDKATETMIKNVAIGTGVILVCVTVSAVSAGVGAPHISMIFAASAKTAPKFAASSAAFGGLSAGLVRGIETGDFEESKEAAALAASEGFKWGAITGAVTGGAKEAFVLKSASKNGITMKEVALAQKESKYSMEVISKFRNFEEYGVYKKANLKNTKVNGRDALVQNIDWNYKSKLPDGTIVTNLDRIDKNLSPIEAATGKPYELHHIGQKPDSPLAVLTQAQHHGNDAILHVSNKVSEIDRAAFAKIKKEFWKDLAKQAVENGGL